MIASPLCTLHAAAALAERDVRAALRSGNLADAATRAAYLPRKRALDSALEALGRATRAPGSLASGS